MKNLAGTWGGGTGREGKSCVSTAGLKQVVVSWSVHGNSVSF